MDHVILNCFVWPCSLANVWSAKCWSWIWPRSPKKRSRNADHRDGRRSLSAEEFPLSSLSLSLSLLRLHPLSNIVSSIFLHSYTAKRSVCCLQSRPLLSTRCLRSSETLDTRVFDFFLLQYRVFFTGPNKFPLDSIGFWSGQYRQPWENKANKWRSTANQRPLFNLRPTASRPSLLKNSQILQVFWDLTRHRCPSVPEEFFFLLRSYHWWSPVQNTAFVQQL